MPDDDFTLNDSMQIAHNCSNNIGGKNHVLAPSATLKDYGIVTSEQLSMLRKDIRVNQAIGLLSYKRSINPNALKDVNNEWTITKLSDVIYDDSFPLELPFALNLDTSNWISDSIDKISPRTQRRKNSQSGYSKQEVIQAGAIGVVIGFLIGFALKRQ